MEEDKKIIHNFTEDNFEIIIEMPAINSTKEKIYIEDISNIMNNELLLQLNK